MKFIDLTKFKSPELIASDIDVPVGSKLRVQVRATHSGYLVYNHRVYPGVAMKKSYKSFVSTENGGDAEYDKPVMRHHDGGLFGGPTDPIGRVRGAKFVALKAGPAFKNDYMNPDTPNNGGRGSGYILLDLEIADPDAIQKILDGRYSTVSVGFTPNAYYCSICGADQLGEGCEHIPGRVYKDDETGEELLCYTITGTMRYNEVSFVNFPAAPLATVIKGTDFENTCTLTRCDRAIGSLVLVDSEGRETDLLVHSVGKPGVHSQKATSNATITVGSAFPTDFLAQESSEDPGTRQDLPDIDGEPDEVTVAHKEEPAHNKLDSSKEDKEMEKKPKSEPDGTTNQVVTDKVLQASLEALTSERDNLKTSLEAKDTEIQKLSGKLEERDAEIERLQGDVDKLRADMARTLAESYLTARIVLGKPGTEGLDSEEAYKEALEKYAKRTTDSLRDSLADLAPELEAFRKAQKEPKKTEPPAPKNVDKVPDPTLGKWTTAKPKGPIDKDEALRRALGGEE